MLSQMVGFASSYEFYIYIYIYIYTYIYTHIYTHTHIHITLYLSIRLLMNTDFTHVLVIVNNAAINLGIDISSRQ